MLKVLLRIIEGSIPLVGDVLENVKSQEGGPGKFVTARFVKTVIKLLVTIAACYLFMKGQIGVDEIEQLTK
jgi:hypothetical protein|tara:strand:+ start:190 stop:402 length:213 start_codon:yes stop_codon:yes gene_type:complete